MNPRIYVLTLVTFAFGSGAFIFAGLLETLAADLGVTTAVAGQLQTVFVLTSAALGPVAAWLFGRVDRKIMVVAALTLGAALHVACAFTPNFSSLMVLRALAGLAGAMSGPAASVAAASWFPRAPGLGPGHGVGRHDAGLRGGHPAGQYHRLGVRLARHLPVRRGHLRRRPGGGAVLPAQDPCAAKARGRRRHGEGAVAHHLALLPDHLPDLRRQHDAQPLHRPHRAGGRRRDGAGVGAFQAMIGVGSIAGLWLGARAANRNAGRNWILQGFIIQATAMSVHFAATHHVLPSGWPSAVLVALGIFLAATALFSITPVIQSSLIKPPAAPGCPGAQRLGDLRRPGPWLDGRRRGARGLRGAGDSRRGPCPVADGADHAGATISTTASPQTGAN
uniref:MFS transporter n=1 Tax=Phenylobacterium glaciei TaxID=2803784 RepID=A0A974P3Q7_9CAUL|nr:MFS transporter [Phenylobacterium glaciei]